ncbi:MAG: hypothetical protein COA79_21095 [Planctomycetota bacterium]|nr:MAG: hypothetical protein COA79_21095 [Planctomycetota bacterium]
MTLAKIIQPGFSTADAEYPEIIIESNGIVLKFVDWQENKVEILFAEAVAYKWQTIETLIEGEADDCSHIIEDSEWVNEHINQDIIGPNDNYIHYKLNFNSTGQFEVISANLVVKT